MRSWRRSRPCGSGGCGARRRRAAPAATTPPPAQTDPSVAPGAPRDASGVQTADAAPASAAHAGRRRQRGAVASRPLPRTMPPISPPTACRPFRTPGRPADGLGRHRHHERRRAGGRAHRPARPRRGTRQHRPAHADARRRSATKPYARGPVPRRSPSDFAPDPAFLGSPDRSARTPSASCSWRRPAVSSLRARRPSGCRRPRPSRAGRRRRSSRSRRCSRTRRQCLTRARSRLRPSGSCSTR